MGVEKTLSRASRSEGGSRPSATNKLNDIRVTSQKQALQHTVRAKKLDERQLYRFLKTLDDSKSRRLLQIDKEVAEVEKLLKRLNSEQEAAQREREQRLNSGDDVPDDAGGDDDEAAAGSVTIKSAGAITGRRHRAGTKKRKTTTKMSKEFDEYAFRARQKRGSVGKLGKEKGDKILDSYYRFDSGGNRRIFSPLISSPSKTPKPSARPAWDADFFLEDVSVSNYTVATGTESRIDSATNKSLGSLADDIVDDPARAETITPGRSVFMTTGKSPSPSNRRTRKMEPKNAAPKGSKSTKIKTPQGMDSMPSRPTNRKSQKGNKPDSETKLQSSTATSNRASAEMESIANVPVVKVVSELDEEIPLGFQRSKLTLKRRPTPPEAESEDNQMGVAMTTEYSEDELQRATNVNACTGKSCSVADCTFHRPPLLRRYSSTIPDPQAAIDEYFRVASATRSRATGQPSIPAVFQPDDERKWSQARRVPVSPPSPTPSEILADVGAERETADDEKPDYTDLDVMLSVRRPMKGSNRDRMLKDKEDNIKNTFKIMRQKMAASVPPDFNTNYGTPTPNWKILNPLKMRHKIAHKSPLFTLWKLN